MAAQKGITKMTRGSRLGGIRKSSVARGGNPSPEEQKEWAPGELSAALPVLPRGFWLPGNVSTVAGASSVSLEPLPHIPRLLLTSSSSLRVDTFLNSLLPKHMVTLTLRHSCCLSKLSSPLFLIPPTWAGYSCHDDSPQFMCLSNNCL